METTKNAKATVYTAAFGAVATCWGTSGDALMGGVRSGYVASLALLPTHKLSITGAVRPVTATISATVNGQPSVSANDLPFADEHDVRSWSPPV
jgi:hypothetical protein